MQDIEDFKQQAPQIEAVEACQKVFGLAIRLSILESVSRMGLPGAFETSSPPCCDLSSEHRQRRLSLFAQADQSQGGSASSCGFNIARAI